MVDGEGGIGNEVEFPPDFEDENAESGRRGTGGRPFLDTGGIPAAVDILCCVVKLQSGLCRGSRAQESRFKYAPVTDVTFHLSL